LVEKKVLKPFRVCIKSEDLRHLWNVNYVMHV